MEREQLLNKMEVCAMVRLSSTTIYKMMKEGTFPRSRRIGSKRVNWLLSEVNEWIRNQPVSDPADWHSPNRQ